MHRFTLRLTLALGCGLLLLAAFVAQSIAADKWVTMYDSKYLPGPVTISVGDTVTWVNDDDLPHDAVGAGWGTPLLTKGDSHAVTFVKAGTYRYTCTIHPGMASRVIVRATGGGIAPPTDTAPEDPVRPTGEAMPAVLTILAAATIAFLLALRRAGRPRA